MTPPLPPGLSPHAGLLRQLLAGWDNGLAIWDPGAYVRPFMDRRLPGRRLLVLNDARQVGRVLTGGVERFRKGGDMRRLLLPLVGDSLFVSEGERWRRQRRLIAPALVHRRHQAGFAAAMVPVLAEAIGRWLSLGPRQELEFTLEATRVAADVVGRLLFSHPLAPQAEILYSSFNVYQDTLGRMDLLGLLGFPDSLPRPGERRARAAAGRLAEVLQGVIRAHPDQAEDLLGRLLREAPDGSPGDTRDAAMTLLLAGHETTAATLSWACFLLATHPAARERLEQEADRVLREREPAFDDLGRLPWARAVVQETLRLYPPIYQFSREPLGVERIAGRELPAGSRLVISPWLLHRHHRYWREPDEFRPERFLEPDGGPRRRYGYIPFGAGTRVCPGAAFATTELTLLLAMMARRLRLELRPGHPVEPLGRLTLRPRYGLPMRVVAR
jgi:cytochrome P450